MVYWRQPSFWMLLFVGWLVTACILFLVFGVTLVFENDDATGWIIAAAIHIVAVISGWNFAKQRIKPRETRGFPVITKAEKDS